LEETVVAIISSEEILEGSELKTETRLGVDDTVTVTSVVVVDVSVIVVVAAEVETVGEDVENTTVVLSSASIKAASKLLDPVEIVADATTVVVTG